MASLPPKPSESSDKLEPEIAVGSREYGPEVVVFHLERFEPHRLVGSPESLVSPHGERDEELRMPASQLLPLARFLKLLERVLPDGLQKCEARFVLRSLLLPEQA